MEALADEPQTVLTQFRARKARAQSAVELELNNAQADFARAYRDYRAFRIRHRLTETEPSYDNVFWRKVFWLALRAFPGLLSALFLLTPAEILPIVRTNPAEGWMRPVLDLDPAIAPASPITALAMFRDQALQPHQAGMAE